MKIKYIKQVTFLRAFSKIIYFEKTVIYLLVKNNISSKNTIDKAGLIKLQS